MQEKKKDEPKSLECEICHLRFVNKNYFESHLKIEHEEHIPPSGIQ
jgi:hypothetical protein